MIGKLSQVSETSLALLAGAAFVVLACIGVINSYSPVPFWDMWDGVVFFENRVSDGELGAFVAQHVNHRTVVSNALFHLDQTVFGGDHRMLFVSSLVFLGGIVGLIAWLCRLVMPGRENAKLVLIVAGLSCVLSFSWIQKENLAWAFQNQMYAVQFFPLLATIALVKAGQAQDAARNLWFALAVVAAFISPYTMMSGLFILPLLVGTALFFRLGWIRTSILGVVSAVAASLFFIGYKNPDIQKDYAGSFFNHIPEFIQFAFKLIGGPASYFPWVGSPDLALAAGALMVITALAMIVWLCWRAETRWVGVVFLVLLGYEAMTAAGIAVGRSGLGMDQSLQSRYMTTSLVTWSIYFALVIYFFRGFFLRPLATLIPLASLLLLTPAQTSALDVSVEPRMERLGAALALELGVKDQAQIGQIWPFFDSIGVLTEGAKMKNISIFGADMLKDAAQKLGASVTLPGPTECEGRVYTTDAVKDDVRFQRLAGIVTSKSGMKLPDAMTIADAKGKAVGYALTSRSVTGVGLSQAGAVQFIGYVQNDREPGALHFIERAGACSFASDAGAAAQGIASGIEANFDVPATWEGAGGGAYPTGLQQASYNLKAMAGARSREWLAVRPGDKLAVDYSVRLVSAPTNGKPPRYVVGAMFLDEKSNVLAWGSVEPPLAEASRSAHIEATAPEGAVRVHLYLGGMWSPEAPPPDGELAYFRAALSVVSRVPAPETPPASAPQ